MATPSASTIRTYVLTASVAAITATGAWYGAGLKARREFTQERAQVLQATPVERIEQMETAKARLLTQKADLQAKIDRLMARDAELKEKTTSQAG